MQSDEVNASDDSCDSTDQITSPMLRQELDERSLAPPHRPIPSVLRRDDRPPPARVVPPAVTRQPVAKATPAFTWPLASAKPSAPVATKPAIVTPRPATPEIVPVPVRARATQPPPVVQAAPTPGAYPIVRPSEPPARPLAIASEAHYSDEPLPFGASVLNARRGKGKLVAVAIIVAIAMGTLAASAFRGSGPTRPSASQKP